MDDLLVPAIIRTLTNNRFAQVRSVYSACMNTPLIEQIGLQPLKDKLKSMGGWPVLEVTINKILYLTRLSMTKL